LFRALVERKIIEFIPRTAEGAKLRVNVALQDDFSMNQTLSLYVHDTLPLMDPQAPDYALVVGNPGRIAGWVCACGVTLTGEAGVPGDTTCSACGARYRAHGASLERIGQGT